MSVKQFTFGKLRYCIERVNKLLSLSLFVIDGYNNLSQRTTYYGLSGDLRLLKTSMCMQYRRNISHFCTPLLTIDQRRVTVQDCWICICENNTVNWVIWVTVIGWSIKSQQTIYSDFQKFRSQCYKISSKSRSNHVYCVVCQFCVFYK